MGRHGGLGGHAEKRPSPDGAIAEHAPGERQPLATIEAVAPFKSAARDGAARLIRDARRRGDDKRAVALRDAWGERLAICTVDGEMSVRDAEGVALEAVRDT